MGVREKTVALLTQGLTPGEIAKRQGVTLATVLGYLDQMVMRGAIRRSDILFSIPKAQRQPILHIIRSTDSATKADIHTRLKRKNIDVDGTDVEVVCRYGDAQHVLGDVYQDVRAIEVSLHERCRAALEDHYGSDDSGWWR